MNKKPLAAIANPPSRLPSLSARLEPVHFLNEGNPPSRSHRKYTTNIQDIVAALLAAGYISLDAQAKALGLNRATAWTIVKVKHKLGRLNTKTIERILANPGTPPRVRATIEEYRAERANAFDRRAKRPLSA